MTEPGKYRILVVDDEPSVLVTYQLILEQEGYDVVACGTSADAIDAVNQQKFDVLLCDYSLEEQHTGFEVISTARKLDPDLPAALLTGYATRETTEEAASQNIGVMFKPIEISEFLATTAGMLRRNNEPYEKSIEKSVSAKNVRGQRHSGAGGRPVSRTGKG